jgi:hypothetical protein
VPPNTEVSKRLASWKSLYFNGDTSNEPLVLASKAKFSRGAVRHLQLRRDPEKLTKELGSLLVDSVLVRLNELDGLEVAFLRSIAREP